MVVEIQPSTTTHTVTANQYNKPNISQVVHKQWLQLSVCEDCQEDSERCEGAVCWWVWEYYGTLSLSVILYDECVDYEKLWVWKIIRNSPVQLYYCPTRPISIPITSCHGYVWLSSSSITFSSGPINISILVPVDGWVSAISIAS